MNTALSARALLDPALIAHATLSVAWACTSPQRAPRLSAALFTLSVTLFAWWLDHHHELAGRPSAWVSLAALLTLAAWRERGVVIMWVRSVWARGELRP